MYFYMVNYFYGFDSMIILQFDRGYLRWGKLFLQSLAKNSPGETVYINSVNLFSFQINNLKKIYSPIIIENHKIKMKRKERGNIMISRKPYVLKEVIKKFGVDRYLLLDADMTIRKPLDNLFAKLDSNDGAFCIDKGIWNGQVYDHLRVASGVILIKPSALPIINKWIEIMENEEEISGIKKGKWFWDQITLWRAIEEAPKLKLGIIETTYRRWDFTDKEAVIWSANVRKKEKGQAFRIMKKDLFKDKR